MPWPFWGIVERYACFPSKSILRAARRSPSRKKKCGAEKPNGGEPECPMPTGVGQKLAQTRAGNDLGHIAPTPYAKGFGYLSLYLKSAILGVNYHVAHDCVARHSYG
jgi:hypothetical protein